MGRSRWGSEEGCKFLLFLSEYKSTRCVVPRRIRTPHCSRPLQLEVADKSYFDFKRLFRLDVHLNDGALLVNGNEKGFANRESVARIEN